MTADCGPAGRIARAAVLGLLLFGVVAAWHWRGLFDPLALQALIERNPLAPLAFLAIHIAASLFFVPRTLLAFAAGILFGMWWGTLWAALGSVAGAIAGFLVARYLNAGLVAEFLERIDRRRLKRLLASVEQGGWRMVALLRLVPVIPHSLTNYALGLTRLGIGAYAAGSLLGQLPLTIAYADLGAAGGRALSGAADWPHRVLWPSLIGVTALGLSLLIPLLVRRRVRQVPGA